MKDSKSLSDAKYEFGNFRLDLVERRLEANGVSVALTPKALDLLAVLVANHGHLLTKEELLDRVWAGSHVEESTLVQNVATLRRALGGRSAGETFIETVPKTGYRFVADVKPVPGKDVLVPAGETTSFLSRGEVEKCVRPKFVERSLLPVLLLLVMAALLVGWIRWDPHQHQRRASASPVLKQLTAFPDSVHFPALSRNGKMLLFIRGGGGFGGGGGEVYLKRLPDGQPFALTHDGLVKLSNRDPPLRSPPH